MSIPSSWLTPSLWCPLHFNTAVSEIFTPPCALFLILLQHIREQLSSLKTDQCEQLWFFLRYTNTLLGNTGDMKVAEDHALKSNRDIINHAF